jgi:hypothetical protein
MDKVIHFEIPVDEFESAQKFYKNIFGWQINEVPGMQYYLINTVEVDETHMPKEPGAINGGMFKRNNSKQSPVIVINVSSIDDYLKKIEESGGKIILPKQKVGDFGLYAQFTDTEGNTIGLWQNLK